MSIPGVRRVSFGFCCLTASLLGMLFAAGPVRAADAVPRPNIVLILADDWGWGDLSCHGHPYLKTPNLDRLASQGQEFLQFNVLNPVCSPSRTAVMTGHYPARYSVHQHFADPSENRQRGMPDWLDPKAPTLPRLLQAAGYRTGHFGKWHLTNRSTHGAPPCSAYGIDEAAVFNGGAEYPEAGLHATASNVCRFIQSHKQRPFYVNMWLHETHLPHVPTKASLDKWSQLAERERVYAAVVSDGDNDVGQVLSALKQAGVEQNTIVLFASDNGPESTGQMRYHGAAPRPSKPAAYGNYYSVGSTGGLRGRKRSLFEGGVRVPFIVRWPGHTPAGRVDRTTVITAVDLLPTLCAAADVALPTDYKPDGENLLPALSGQAMKRSKAIFWEWQGTRREPDWWPRLAVRDGDWKLLMTYDQSRTELYHELEDRPEKHDLAASHPEIVERLSRMVLDWKATLPAKPPTDCISSTKR